MSKNVVFSKGTVDLKTSSPGRREADRDVQLLGVDDLTEETRDRVLLLIKLAGEEGINSKYLLELESEGLVDPAEIQRAINYAVEMDFYEEKVESLKADVQKLVDLFNALDLDKFKGEIGEDVNTSRQSLAALSDIVNGFKPENFAEYLKRKDKGPINKFVHDSNNKLAAMRGFNSFVIDTLDENHKERSKFMQIIDQTESLIEKIQHLKEKKEATQDGFNLVRKDLDFIIVEDDPQITGLLKRRLEGTSKSVKTVINQGELQQLDDSEDQVVILLDNDLGEGQYGHQLIDDLKRKFPNGYIIVHTGDKETLEINPKNPYKNRVAGMVGKNDMATISRYINALFDRRNPSN